MYTIVAISDSDKHFKEVVKEYEKRLGKQVTIEHCKPVKIWTHEQIIQKETEHITQILEKKYAHHIKIYLSKEWEQITTEQFHKYCIGKNIVFIIWGPYGLDEEKITKYVDKKIAFWKITIQHGLAQVILLEQLYRISCIQSGKQYHY